jgi:hypothetical protein
MTNDSPHAAVTLRTVSGGAAECAVELLDAKIM